MAATHPTNPDCVFCKIVAGQIPCYKLYEDEQLIAFLDIGPLSRGHSLIVPKGHWETIDQMPAEVAAACGKVLPRLSRAVVTAVGVSAWNVLQNNGRLSGQAVPHVHFHIIPRKENDGLGYRWPAGKLDSSEAQELLEAIRRHL